ncbi:MAG: hypothetical protein DK306_001025 [Chloroflexi bacterium]|nr:MAG: hypothetical protein DK306_001025 [Chloroflexota bacterium]
MTQGSAEVTYSEAEPMRVAVVSDYI